jgi:hypothetical protein
MNATYDTSKWAAETTLGRHVFNANFRLTGSELRGWELVNVVAMEHEPGVTEHVYVLRKTGARRETLIRVGIVEHDSWRAAQQRLHTMLLHCMRPDIPRAAGILEQTGDVGFAAYDARAAASVFFVRGNVLVTVASVGEATVDVSTLARKLDAALCKPPRDAELKSGLAEHRSPRSFEVKKARPVAVIESLPQATAADSQVKVIAPDGELHREDDRLVYVSQSGGRKRVGQYVYTRAR